MSFTSSVNQSLTYDETVHLAAGYYYWQTNKYDLEVGHPPLIKKMASLPLLFFDLKFPYEHEDCQKLYRWRCAEQFLFQSNGNIDNLILLARIPFILIGLILGFFIFLWAKDLYGPKSGLFSLLIYSFSPKILAHSSMLLTDFVVTAFMFMGVYFLWKWIKTDSKKYLFLTAILSALAQFTKITALFLIPIYFLIIMFKTSKLKEKSKRFFKLMIYCFVAFVLVGLIVFGFEFKTIDRTVPPRYVDEGFKMLDDIYPKGSFVNNVATHTVRNVPLPFASYFSGMILMASNSMGQVKSSYLMGNIYTGGHWNYFVIEFLLKTPIAILIFLLLTIIFFKKVKRDNFDELCLIIPFVFLFLVFLPNHVNQGIRHLLPIYPFIFVFIGKIVNLKIKKQILFGILTILLLMWYIAGTIMIYPHYFAYFNEFAGGPGNGYNYLVDGNLDLGQDLKGLKLYMDKNNISKIQLSYFGSANPSYYGINYYYLPSPESEPWVPAEHSFRLDIPSNYTENCSKRNGLIAISATNLVGKNLQNHSCYGWLEEYEPIDKIGYSIFIYNIGGVKNEKNYNK